MRVGQTNNPIQGTEVSNADKTGNAAATKEARKTDRAGQPESAAAGAGQTSPSSSRAEISSKSREFAQAKSVADGTPDVREEKIAELKRRIAAGQYKVDNDAIADRMVDDHIRMSGIG